MEMLEGAPVLFRQFFCCILADLSAQRWGHDELPRWLASQGQRQLGHLGEIIEQRLAS
jgi:hypothetical protein